MFVAAKIALIGAEQGEEINGLLHPLISHL